MKKALITGVTGQDGSYLAELLIEKGYEVHGLKRRSSSFNTQRIDHIFENYGLGNAPKFFLHYGDLSDSSSVTNLINKIRPDEIYNLAAQSHVGVSFDMPEYTADIVGLGCLRILEAIRFLNLERKIKFYQASSSELYGKVQEVPQKESTPFYPRSPYAVSKMFAYWITINYREAYNMYACNGILFNHESPRRGETFVTRKITRGLSRIATGLQDILFLGNLNAKRDWGHAKDYVEMQWLMLQQENPQDFVISTGTQYSVKEFIVLCCQCLGFEVDFQGEGKAEVGYIKTIFDSSKKLNVKEGDIIIKVDEKYFRPSEVETLLGDSTRAMNDLGWKPKISTKELAYEMMSEDFAKAEDLAFLKNRKR